MLLMNVYVFGNLSTIFTHHFLSNFAANQKVSQADINKIADCIKVDDNRYEFYTNLKLERRDVLAKEDEAGNNRKFKAQGVLHMWLQRTGRDATRLSALKALPEGCKGIRDELIAEWAK